MYKFPCGQWFSGEDGDRQTYREILSTQNMAMVEGLYNYNTLCALNFSSIYLDFQIFYQIVIKKSVIKLSLQGFSF